MTRLEISPRRLLIDLDIESQADVVTGLDSMKRGTMMNKRKTNDSWI